MQPLLDHHGVRARHEERLRRGLAAFAELPAGPRRRRHELCPLSAIARRLRARRHGATRPMTV
jgi:hypothetical protein